MNKLLTIAIPTYNRADLLDKQLEWLSQAIKGYESECEIFVSDNCSSDHTQEVIQKWQENIKNVNFKSNRHIENLGVMKNIMYCLISATTKYVMIVHNFQQVNLKVFLGALRRWPISAIQTVIPFLAIVSISAVEVIAAPEVKIAAIKNLSLKL